MNHSLKCAVCVVALLGSPASAEMELSLYMGVQSVQDSTGSGFLPGGRPFSHKFNWKGKPLDNPYYYGGRAIWWTQQNIGFGLEGTHAKAYASATDLIAIGARSFELSDGHNIVTANIMKRWPGVFSNKNFTPYVGAGAGVAIPHVDVSLNSGPIRTFGYENTGMALRGIAGMKYEINERWSLFSEYQITWSDNDITVDPTNFGELPGKVSADIVTHAVNFGVSLSF